MKNVIIRSLSGLVYVGLIVGATLAGSVYFQILILLLALWGIIEFTKVSNTYPTINKSMLAVDAAGACVLACMSSVSFLTGTILSLYILVRFTSALYDRREHALRAAAKSLMGVIYIGLPLSMLSELYHMTNEWVVLLMFIMIWLNDTGAFCFGSLLGKHRLFPRLSPKKSWEGFWGGMLCCVACGAVCYYSLNDLLHLGLIGSLAMGALVSVFSTWGDLFESMLKRTMGVKDSGHLIPGHGGILDRIDSLLFVAPAVSALYFIMEVLF